MKRFTETNKWQDPWFRRLSGPAKMLWFYLIDHSNQIGVVDLDLGLASADTGLELTQDNVAELGDRIQDIGDGKVFMPKFIHFQYGNLSAKCPPHRRILEMVEKFGLEENETDFSYPNARVVIPLKKGKDKKGEDKKEELPFNCDEFARVWQDWVAFRKESKKPMKPTTIKQQWQKMRKWGKELSIATMRRSIENGWQGLFPPNQDASGKRPIMELTNYQKDGIQRRPYD